MGSHHESPFRRAGLIARVGPFAVAAFAGCVLALLPTDSRDPAALGAGLGISAAVVLAAFLLPWRRLPAWAEAGPPLAYLLAVALLREGNGGAESGLAPLVALPVIWIALHGSRRQLVLAIAGVAAVFFVPLVALGEPGYPESELRRGILWVLVSSVLGYTVQSLVQLVRGQAGELADRAESLRAAEHRAQMTSERLEGVLRAATEYSVIGTDTEGLITVFNEGAERMLGYPSSEMIGIHTPALIHDPDEVAARARELGIEPGFEVFVAAARRGEAETRDWTYVRKDGSRLTAQLTVTAIRSGDELTGFIGIAADVTARRRSERELQASEAALSAVTRVAHEIATSTDARQAVCAAAREVGAGDMAMILEPDSRSLVMTAASGIELPPVRVDRGVEPSGAAVAFASAQRFFVTDALGHPAVSQRLLEATGVASVLFEPIVRDGRTVGVLVVGWRTRLERLERQPGLALRMLAAEAAVAIERSDLLRRLDELAHTDELTGVANRRTWERELAQELERAKRSARPLCVAMLDLDHFKAYNDRRGHQAGDRLLRTAAASWREGLREVDLLARYGGEEFGLLLPDCAEDDAVAVVQRLCSATPEEQTCSAGVAEWDGREQAESLVARADAALYAAKQAGRDAVRTAARS